MSLLVVLAATYLTAGCDMIASRPLATTSAQCHSR